MTPQPVPPTPTFLPPGTALFSIPSSVTLWGAAPYAIQTWHMLPNAGQTIIQVVFLIAILIAVAYILMRFGKDFTSKNAED